MWWLKRTAALLAVHFGLIAGAFASTSNVQAHLKGGMVNGTFTGIVSGGFSVSTSIEGEGEYLYSSHISLFSRATVALEPSSGQFKYIYMGLGQRYYFLSRGNSLESNYDGMYVEIVPRMRYFADWQLGLSQIQVKAETATLVAQATLLEYGVGLGAIYQVARNIGIEGSLGVSKGIAMSSVSVDSLIIRGLAGVVSSF